MCVDHLPACLGLVMLQIWMCRTKPDVPLKSKMIQKNMFCCENRTPSRLHPSFHYAFWSQFPWVAEGMTFAARAEPQVHQYKLDKPHKLDMLKSNKNISNMVIYVYRIYTSCKHVRVCVCVVDIHVVHCFYEVRKYKIIVVEWFVQISCRGEWTWKRKKTCGV